LDDVEEVLGHQHDLAAIRQPAQRRTVGGSKVRRCRPLLRPTATHLRQRPQVELAHLQLLTHLDTLSVAQDAVWALLVSDVVSVTESTPDASWKGLYTLLGLLPPGGSPGVGNREPHPGRQHQGHRGEAVPQALICWTKHGVQVG